MGEKEKSIYRKIDICIWNDAKFSRLSANGKLAFFFVLTHPQMTPLGAMRGSLDGLASELKIPVEDMREVFHEVFPEDLPKGFPKDLPKALAKAIPKDLNDGFGKLAICDKNNSCLFVPNFVKYQGAVSPNVIKAWQKAPRWPVKFPHLWPLKIPHPDVRITS